MSFIIGSGVWIVALIGIFVLPASQIALAYALACLSGLGIATAYVIPWSMLPDVIEHDQLRSGQRREGSYYAMAALFQKLGTGAALWGMAQVLAWNNYISADSSIDVITQPPEAVLAIRFFGGPVPAVLLLAGIIFAWKYPITRRAHKKHLEELAQGRNGGGV
jgi:GPH family glycoside/pentoside/hexuronide:cation symporter